MSYFAVCVAPEVTGLRVTDATGESCPLVVCKVSSGPTHGASKETLERWGRKKKRIAGEGVKGIFFDLRPSIAIRRAVAVLCTINVLCHLATR